MSKRMKKVSDIQCALVTGGAGFVGHHLARHLLNLGTKVRILDDLSTGKRENVPAETVFIEGDIRDPQTVAHVMNGCDVVFHLAARVELQKSIVDPVDCYSVNVDGTAAIVREAIQQKVRRLIFASSCAVYPLHPKNPLSEKMATIGETPYALSKRAGEQTLQIYSRLQGLGSCSLRCFNIYGPGQRIDSPYAAVIPKFVNFALSGQPIPLYGGGTQTRDFIHVTDVAKAYVLAASSDATGVFNLGTGRSTSVKTLATIISRFDGKSKIVAKPPLPGDATSSQANIGAIRKAFGFKPSISLEAGLRDLYFSMKDQLTIKT